jgi:dolichol-phosphate mannosyltransferase
MIADNDFVLDMAEFLLMTRRVRDEVLNLANSFPFIRNDVAYIGFRRTGIDYVRQKRMAGQSYMNIFKMVVHASAFILTASTFPIRLASYIGVFLLPTNIIAMALGGFLEHTVNALDNCYVIYCLVFISTYIARIYKNGLNRPLFIVDWERSLINEGTTATTTLEKTA